MFGLGTPPGARGERAAARHLRRHGYRILARNLRTPRGELDLVARHAHVLVVIEVKTRTTPDAPPHRVPHRQRMRLLAAARWLAHRPSLRTATGGPCAFRIDFAFVTLDGRRAAVTIRRDVLPHG